MPANLNTALRELAALLPGQVTVPGDPGWDDVRLGWVRSVDQRRPARSPCTTTRTWSLPSPGPRPRRHRLGAAGRARCHHCGQRHGPAADPGAVRHHHRPRRRHGPGRRRREAAKSLTALTGSRRHRSGRHLPDTSVVGYTLGGGGSAGSAGHTAWPRTVCSPWTWSTPPGGCGGSPAPPTPTCSGRSVAVAVTSGSSRRWRSPAPRPARLRRPAVVACRDGPPGAGGVPRDHPAARTSSPCGPSCCASRRCPRSRRPSDGGAS